MAKQVKIGFERVPIPTVKDLRPLFDIGTGSALRNATGDLLFTEEEGALRQFGGSKNSLSVNINNDSERPVGVEEQFQETSQVSSTLLGVERAETQLGLFSDVSIYGQDDNIWEFFRSPNPIAPLEWTRRFNPTYGPRYNPRLEEVPNEQALALTAFPVPWTFAYGPQFQFVGLFNQTAFENYRRFIRLGNELYDFYNVRGFTEFAEENFLPGRFAIDSQGETDVLYNEEDFTLDEIFAQIEKWTLAWMKLRDQQLFDPSGSRVSFFEGFDSSNTSPGLSSSGSYFSQLQSKRSFRYQPGRISGFTFGVRASTDPGSAQNVIEWGCANNTDQYMFQIRGSQFNLVRRSTVPLPERNLQRLNLTLDDQVFRNGLWETVISRERFNGDSLNGNGPSGYVITFEEVTMYKIEFSWYGAIGAKFYAYIPVGNGDTRWVLIHTIIIENELGQPCLENPFFKFRYTMNLVDTSNLVFPQYIYKYGASYYIDGGDEGTVTNHSYTSDVVNANPINSRSLLGIASKNVIFNRDGIPIENTKDIIPIKMTVTATKAAKIDIVECRGCPGHSYHYAPGLRNGVSGVTGTLTINEAGTEVFFDPDDTNLEPIDFLYSDPDLFTKVIADGIFSTYLYIKPDGTIGIARRAAISRINNDPSPDRTFSDTELVIRGGQPVPVKGQVFENVRLTQWSDIAASSVPLSKENIMVNFLNPRRSDGRHFAEFFIGITNLEPTIDQVEGTLLFDNQPLNLSNLLFAEYAQYSANKNTRGYDNGESDRRLGRVFEMDYRLSNPPGVDSGRCSQARISVSSDLSFDVESASNNPVTGQPGNFLIFSSDGIADIDDLEGGELAFFNESTGILEGLGIFFVDNQVTSYLDTQTQNTRFYIEITQNLPATISEVFLRLITIRSTYIEKSKVFSWDIFPLYVVVGMRDQAQINNVTITEMDEISKFTHVPVWLKAEDSNIEVLNSGVVSEGFNSNTGLYESGGLSNEGDPPANFVEVNRLDAALIDSQLQQPLRPGEIRGTFYINDNESLEVDLSHLFGQDRYVITPGFLNTTATFFISKTLQDNGEVQVSVNTKEQ